MPRSPIHTFVILAYKNSPYLDSCIDSLKNQTIKSDILLSTSTPSLFLQEMTEKHRIPYLINSKKNGIAADWTYAYNSCQKELVTLAHQDDIYLPCYTERCLAAAERWNNCLIIFTNYKEFRNSKMQDNNLILTIKRLILSTFYLFQDNLSSPALKKIMISMGNPICCPTIMYNKKNIGHFEFNTSFSMNLDWEANLTLSKKKGDFVYIKTKLLARRIHSESESTYAILNKNRHEEDKKLFEKFWPNHIVKLILKFYSLAYKIDGKR